MGLFDGKRGVIFGIANDHVTVLHPLCQVVSVRG